MSTIKHKYQGLHKHRYVTDPLERDFAKAWQDLNEVVDDRSVLNYLMDKTNRGDLKLTDRDWTVANTLIQWLGSPVGQVFLTSVLEGKHGKFFRANLARTDKKDSNNEQASDY